MAPKRREYEEIELTDSAEIEAVHAGRLDGFIYADGVVYAPAAALYEYRQRRAAERNDSITNSIDVEHDDSSDDMSCPYCGDCRDAGE